MSSGDSHRISRRRALLAGAGLVGLGSVGTVSGYRLLATDRETETSTHRLTVDDEFDVDEIELEPAGEDGPDGGRVAQRCDPNPNRWSTGSHFSNLTLIDAWSERYRMWGSEDEDGNEDEGDRPDHTRSGVDVQNTLTLDKAPERVDGTYLYGVRLYSQCHLEDTRLSRHRLRRLEHELVVDPDVEVRTVLPSSPITPEHGLCTMTLLTELPSGWNAGYEQYWFVDDGRIETDYDDETVTLSYEGNTANSVAMKGLLELRTERPLSEFSEPFEWTVRGEATRRGL